MKEYFSLQFKMLSRRFTESGIHPLVGYMLSLILFILISEFLFYKTEFANYALILIAFTFLLKLNDARRNEFLKIIFDDKKSKIIRLTENLLLCLPFSLVLVFHHYPIESISLILIGTLLSGFTFHTNLHYALPTPFFKRPFEFTVGFRNTFFLLPLAYLLTYVSLKADNLNLGLFSMLTVFLLSISYHIHPEKEFYIWSYSCQPRTFLLRKIMTAALYTTCMMVPIPFTLLLFYPKDWALLLLFIFLGYSFLGLVILAKYSAYPREMSIPEGILMAICIYFPPLLVALIPYFYRKSVQQLNFLLK